MTPEEKRESINAISMGLLIQLRIFAEERGFVNAHYRKRKDGTSSYTFIVNTDEGNWL